MNDTVNDNKGYSVIRNILHNGEYDSLRGHIRKAGLGYGTVQARLSKGLSLEEALTMPPGKSGTRYHGNPPSKPPLKREQHGMADSSEYNIYHKMIRRCHDETDKGFPYYGARGITVCDRWRSKFGFFLEDMGFRPTNEHSIDRIDNNKGYSPDNCRWATKSEQSNNRRNNRIVTYEGEQLTAAELARKLDISEEFIYRRLNKGHNSEEIIQMAKEYHNTFYNYKGRSMTLTAISKEVGLNHVTIKKRMEKGLTLEEAVELPRMSGKYLISRIDR